MHADIIVHNDREGHEKPLREYYGEEEKTKSLFQNGRRHVIVRSHKGHNLIARSHKVKGELSTIIELDLSQYCIIHGESTHILTL